MRDENAPTLSRIKTWLTASQRLLKEDMSGVVKGRGSLGFANLFTDFIVEDKSNCK